MTNPFCFKRWDGTPAEYVDAASRISAVQHFDTRTCLDAMELPGLQGTVKQAIQRRLRKLDLKSRAKP